MNQPPGYGALRHHRASIIGATYFVTLCTRSRKLGLNKNQLASVEQIILALQ